MEDDDQARIALPTPNCYWVEPGRLLAGEYPGGLGGATPQEHIARLLRAGIDSFIDLTEENELPHYLAELRVDDGRRIHHQRFAIRDHSIPETHAHISHILDAIDAELAEGRNVYVHCHAGIGRTGTVIACYLIRRGMTNEAALERLQALWSQCARSRRWGSVPETPEQTAFVRAWVDTAKGTAVVAARREAALLGLALGEALGWLVQQRAIAAADVLDAFDTTPVFVSGFETATTLCALDSLLASGGHDAREELQRYEQWMRTSEAARTLMPADFKRAVATWQWSRKASGGSHDPRNLDPHTLARCLAVALFARGDAELALELAPEVSRTTLQSPVVLDACRVWTATLHDALAGVSRAELVRFAGPAMQQVRTRTLRPQVAQLLSAGVQTVTDGQDVVAVIGGAMHAFSRADNFAACIAQVTAKSALPATSAALAGALAGAHWGAEAIAARWTERLRGAARIRQCLALLAG